MWPASLLTFDVRREFRRLLAMEMGTLRLIESLMQRLPSHMHAGVLAHYNETLWQADLLRTSVELMGAESFATPVQPDRRVALGKVDGLYALRAQNAFEISNYQSAITVAHRVPVPELAEICEELLACEKSFNRWLAMQTDVTEPTALSSPAWPMPTAACPQASLWPA